MLTVGTLAPNFTAQTHEGKTLSLASLSGKKVLLWFYPKADTPGWTTEGRGFRDQIEEFRMRNIEILGVSCDTVAENAAFAQKYGFPFPLLCDTDRTIGVAYGACDNAKAGFAKRISYVIDETGTIIKAYDSVSPRNHPTEVLADLAS